MPDDWSWMWTSEAGRSRMLRDEIEGLQGASSRAQAQTARLSSQLANLQGSLATRIDALSTAFDAYVELGDVREQLDDFPDTAAVRRDASSAISLLTRGGTPEPVDDRGQGYWLAYAVNALIGIAGGHPDTAAEDRARELDRSAEPFIVAAAGALGHGGEVADRLPDLLVCDGGLTDAQLALWRAALADLFGDIVPAIGAVWRPVLATDGPGWAEWAKSRGRTASATEALRWVNDELVGPAPARADVAKPAAGSGPVAADALVLAGEPSSRTPADPLLDPRQGLQEIVGRLISQGMGDEVALLVRARVLRARITDPGSPIPDDPAQGGEPSVSDLTAEIQAVLVAAPRESTRRQQLLSWVLPGLLAGTSALESEAEQTAVQRVEARTPAGLIDVSSDGPDQARVARGDAGLVALHAVPTTRMAVPAGFAGAALLGAVLCFVLRVPVLGVLLAGVGVVAVVFALRALRDRRRGERALAEARTTMTKALDYAQQQAKSIEQARLDAVAEAHGLALAIRDGAKSLQPVAVDTA